MKISELVAELEALRAEHGDVEVLYEVEDCCGSSEYDPTPVFDAGKVWL